MTVNWDYSDFAESYLKRPNYSEMAFDTFISITQTSVGMKCCDIGAGAAHLTEMLADYGLEVTAIEPNDKMRENGIKKTNRFSNVQWFAGTGEVTGQQTNDFDIVTFGSSFNVCDRPVTLVEVSRILKKNGWFICLWNHRDLNDPIQAEIESLIKKVVPEYAHGIRREDQTAIIQASGLFHNIKQFSGSVEQTQSVSDCVEAWRSHATLSRQGGERFSSIIDDINSFLETLEQSSIKIPYTTVGWVAQKK